MKIAENIKYYLKIKKLKPSNLAKLAGIPQAGLSDILNEITKRPRIDTIEKLAKALDISISDLTGDAGGGISVNEEKAHYGADEEMNKLLDIAIGQLKHMSRKELAQFIADTIKESTDEEKERK